MALKNGCQCEECKKLPDGTGHRSDCAVHNEPAELKRECDCRKHKPKTKPKDWSQIKTIIGDYRVPSDVLASYGETALPEAIAEIEQLRQEKADADQIRAEAMAEIHQLRQEKAELVKMTVRILSDLEIMMSYCSERDKYHIQKDRNQNYLDALAKLEGGEQK